MEELRLMELAQRLDRVERQNRWWLRGVGGLVLAWLGFLALAGASPTNIPNEIRAKRFVLVDTAGTPRGLLHMERDESVSLNLYGGDKRSGARLSALADGSMALTLFGRFDGKPRSMLMVQGDGATGLGLVDKDGRSRVVLGVDAEGLPKASVFDNAGRVIWKAP